MFNLKMQAYFYHPCVKLNERNEWEGEWFIGEVLTYHILNHKVRVRPLGKPELTRDVKVGDKCFLRYFAQRKDVEGNDIYTDDLVKIRGDDDTIYKVKFCPQSARFYLEEAEPCFGIVYPVNKVKIVIGNIYENKDLIKEA